MNKLMRVTSSLMMLWLGVQLFGCGGGSNHVAGIDGSGAPVTSASGTVNGFGSVIVNGVRYHSDKTKFLVNGQIADESSLHTGYQVRVTGTLNSDGTGTANTIEFNPNLIGAITQIDLQNEQLVLLGQTVQITNTTLFDTAITPNDLSGLTVGNEILVSGQINSEGLIAATRIELTTQQNHQLSGVISNLNIATTTFSLNNLTINYSGATLNNFPDNQLKNALNIHVFGSLDSQGIFKAQIINFQNSTFSADVKNADIEGFITRFVNSSDFDVAGIPCSSNSTTTYSNGSSTDLALGSSIKVNGSVNTAGVLVAQKIEFRQQVINEINGQVSSVSTPVTGAIATGTLHIANTDIQTNNSTVYEDGGGDRLRRFNFLSIHVNDFLKVTGYTSGTVFIATKIERKIPLTDNPIRYEGLITQVDSNAQSIVIYGQTLYINSQTEIHGAMGVTLTAAQFLAQALNQQVRLEGTVRNGVFTATRVDIRSLNEDDFHQPRDGGGHQPGGTPQNGGMLH